MPAQGVAGVEAVHAEMTQQRLEEVVLGRVLEQVGLEAVCADLDETRGIMDYIKCNCYCCCYKLHASIKIDFPICNAKDPSDRSDISNANATCNQATYSSLQMVCLFLCSVLTTFVI